MLVQVPLTIRDHLARARTVYPDRIAFVDEPEQPAESMGTVTFRRMGELADAMGAGLDRLTPLPEEPAEAHRGAKLEHSCALTASDPDRLPEPSLRRRRVSRAK